MIIYLIGSLRNPEVPHIANVLRNDGHDVFDDWYSAGPTADDTLYAYEKQRNHGVREALQGYAARHIFDFDKQHIERADVVVLVMPAGKSGHIELGWALGRGKPGYVLFTTEPERIDIMWQLATDVYDNLPDLQEELRYVASWFFNAR